MKLNFLTTTLCCFYFLAATAQLTPEKLQEVGRVSGVGITVDGKNVVYSVSVPNVEENKSKRNLFSIPLAGGAAVKIDSVGNLIKNRLISADGLYQLSTQEVKVKKVLGTDLYPNYPKNSAQVYDDLHYRHWDKWEDGSFNHVFLHKIVNGKPDKGIDLMPNEPYDCPTLPMGDENDFTFSADGKSVVYVCKKKFGTAYAISTNTELYSYDIATQKTTVLTKGAGYDVDPAFSSTGNLAWLSMKRDGFEADKNDIIVSGKAGEMNLTASWDGTVASFLWAADGKKIYFIAAVDGTLQLFEVDYPGTSKKAPVVVQLTSGEFDVSSIIGQSGNTLVVSRNDMNRAPELYTYDIAKKVLTQLTKANDNFYAKIPKSKIEKRYVDTKDGKKMLVWVVYPPNFDPARKYPTLLYCQGGPQSALTQIYSFRWNFQLMAANGYIVVAPNRRGMPGHGVEWNEQISKDWGGMVMIDYLLAIDNMAKEPFVDKDRLGAVGASYGGYSVFYLAGIHQKRFKTFIAHAGVFNLKSMYGTTEEVFFPNFDWNGAYWEKDNVIAQRTYSEFNPIEKVGEWNTPMLITHGGKDYRVPEGQGFEAFQALQLRGIRSRFLYLPDENHWILKPQNALVWQKEFYRWLKETL
jgi:dipeptidyl aminopeptidase/acylaminoacyl peptidase